jgi:hypothetical protein
MKWSMMICCTVALCLTQSGLARAANADLGDSRLAPLDDPYSVRFQGGPPEVTREKIAQAIKSIGATRGWTVAREAEGRMDLTLLVRGQHEASVEVEYDASAYSLRYVRSVNLLYREQLRSGVALRVIHRNYNGWIKGLVTGVNNSIPAPAQVVVGFAPFGDADAVPYIGERGRGVYREFTALPAPRAFAIAPNGTWGRDSYKNVQSSFRRDVVENALEFCNRRGGNGECRLYAIDDRVVWTKTNAPADKKDGR